MTSLINKGFHPRQLARKRRLYKAKANPAAEEAARIAYTTQPPHDPTIRCRLLEPPDQLLLPVLEHATMNANDENDLFGPVDITGMVGHEMVSANCDYDRLIGFIRTIGFTCRRMYSLLPGVLLERFHCHVDYPQSAHTHFSLEKQLFKKGLRSVVDTPLYQKLAKHIIVHLQFEKWNNEISDVPELERMLFGVEDYGIPASIERALKGLERLEKVTLQIERYKGSPPHESRSCFRREMYGTVASALNPTKRPVELRIEVMLKDRAPE
ncbi:hypothetical protein LTR95_007050 [Oleoguttula sp. CCFEE 5521]